MIKIYPVSIEAVDEQGECMFKLETFDERSATIKVTTLITNGNIDWFCNSLKRALIMLDLERDGDEDQQSGEISE